MVWEIVFEVNKLPHPDSKHLGSRIWNKALIGKYCSDRIVILPRKLEYVNELIEYVSHYIIKRNVKIINVKRMGF